MHLSQKVWESATDKISQLRWHPFTPSPNPNPNPNPDWRWCGARPAVGEYPHNVFAILTNRHDGAHEVHLHYTSGRAVLEGELDLATLPEVRP